MDLAYYWRVYEVPVSIGGLCVALAVAVVAVPAVYGGSAVGAPAAGETWPKAPTRSRGGLRRVLRQSTSSVSRRARFRCTVGEAAARASCSRRVGSLSYCAWASVVVMPPTVPPVTPR